MIHPDHIEDIITLVNTNKVPPRVGEKFLRVLANYIQGKQFYKGAVIETPETIRRWADDTFGPVTTLRNAIRANEEMAECLKAAFGEGQESFVKEAADVVIVLCRTPGLWEAVEAKMEINRGRKWHIGADGCAYHVKDA